MQPTFQGTYIIFELYVQIQTPALNDKMHDSTVI